MIDAGIELLAEHGDESAVTLRGVARAAGVAAPSVYAHFDGPSPLLNEVVSAAWARFADAMARAMSGHNDALDRLRAGVYAYIQYGLDYPGLYRVVFSRTSPSAFTAVGEAAGQLFATLESMVAQASGNQLSEAQARNRAIDLWITAHGYATLRPSQPRFDWPPHNQVVDEMIEHATRS